MKNKQLKIIFFGNGLLAEGALAELGKTNEIIFHARTKDDLEAALKMKKAQPEAFGVLASFGQILKPEILEAFEPEGILNLHPSMLPKYRGPAPIETGMLNGDRKFGVSIMKIIRRMDAGPIFWQTEFDIDRQAQKAEIYEKLAREGTRWIAANLRNLPSPAPQDEKVASYTHKLDTTMAKLRPKEQSADEMERQVRAFANFPKTRWSFYGKECVILKARTANEAKENEIAIEGKDGRFLIVEELQPNSKKPMSAKAFLNGYRK